MLQVIGQVQRNELAAGSRLPPIRAVALQLGVNRNTVALVYKELAEKGYLEARFGAGSTVRKPAEGTVRKPAEDIARNPAEGTEANRTPVARNNGAGAAGGGLRKSRETQSAAPPRAAIPLPAAESVPRPFSVADWEQRFAAALGGSAAQAAPAGNGLGSASAINLSSLHPFTGLFPAEVFRRCLNTVLRRQGRALLNYGATMGYLPLRERIAARLTRAGFPVQPAQVLITSGSQQGIDLLARAFLNPGDRVAVESPMYSIARKIFLMHGAALLPYPVLASGIDLAPLEGRAGVSEPGSPALAARESPKLFYAVPNFQNPTTHCYSLPEKQALLAQVYRSGALLIEDASDGELHPEHASRPPLAALDGAERVIHLNSFSKTLVPAVRVGYLAGPEPVLRRLSELKEMTDLSHSPIMQAGIVEFMERGWFDKHVQAVREFYSLRMERVQGMLAEELPSDVSYSSPPGGLCVWVDLPPQVDSLEAQRRMAGRGVLISPGALYQPAPYPPAAGARNGLRLCVANEPETRVRQGLKLLGRELRQWLRHVPAPQSPREYQSIN